MAQRVKLRWITSKASHPIVYSGWAVSDSHRSSLFLKIDLDVVSSTNNRWPANLAIWSASVKRAVKL